MLMGSTGYYYIFEGNSSFIDCLYMTVISLTTVGYGEVLGITGNPSAQIFTMLLITFGMGIILYSISTVTAMLIEGELTGMLRRRKMENKIKALSGHYIVCGGGETGFPLAVELVTSKASVVLIDLECDIIEASRQIKGLYHVHGDATDDKNLVAAGIERATGITICLPSDNDNLYITMTARMLNPKARIISRMTNSRLKPKLLKAGATSVVSPNAIGALRMASEMIRPAAVDFMDNMLRSERGELRINQLEVHGNSSLVGKTIMKSGLRDQFNLLLLGVRRKDGEFEFRPPSSFVLKAGMTLIVMGDIENIDLARAAL
jgi:voltage-gated potassium channel